MRLDGLTALITGGTQGIGAAIAKRFATAGCDLVLQGFEENDEARATITECRKSGIRVDASFCDLAGPTKEVLTKFIESLGRPLDSVTILVNNVGTYREPSFLDVTFEDFERTLRLNVEFGYFLTQSMAKAWVANSVSGRVVFTGSINGVLSEPDHSVYDTSKGAVHAMVRSLAVSLAPHRIRVNGMAPGLVLTPLTAPALTADKSVLEWMKLHTPNETVPGPESCAGAALFLVSDEAEHIHGQTLLVDGGMSAWQQPDLPQQLRGSL